MKKKVSILIPCYNEADSLPLLGEALRQLMDSQPGYDWEVLLVNDGSGDNTLDGMKLLHRQDNRIGYISLSRNFGKERAMLAGLDNVSGHCTIIMDADLQHPVSLVPDMLECWNQGYQDVYAQRTQRGRESWLRRHLTMVYYHILQKAAKIDILPNVGDFRLLDRSCVDALCQLRETQRYTKGLYCWIGFRKKKISFEQQDRQTGKSSFGYRRLFNLAIEGITSYSIAPLRFSTLLGMMVSLCAFIYLCYVLGKTLIYGDPVQGFPTLITVILFLGGVQLISLGIIGEYLGRIFMETKQRPVYLVSEKQLAGEQTEDDD